MVGAQNGAPARPRRQTRRTRRGWPPSQDLLIVQWGNSPDRRRANIVLPTPGGPDIRMWCPPAAATAKARQASGCPTTSDSSGKSSAPAGSCAGTGSGTSRPAQNLDGLAQRVDGDHIEGRQSSDPAGGGCRSEDPLDRGSARIDPSAMATPPGTERMEPSNPNSPTNTEPSTAACRTIPSPARTPTATARSRPDPRLCSNAGRQTDQDLAGRPVEPAGDESRTNPIARLRDGGVRQPTMVMPGNPWERWTWTSITWPSSPRHTAPRVCATVLTRHRARG